MTAREFNCISKQLKDLKSPQVPMDQSKKQKSNYGGGAGPGLLHSCIEGTGADREQTLNVQPNPTGFLMGFTPK